MSEEAVLYLGNLGLRTSEDDVRRDLVRVGVDVADVRIFSKLSNGRSLGWACVVFKNRRDLEAAKFVLSEPTTINFRIPILEEAAPDLGELLDPMERILTESSHDCLGIGVVPDDRVRVLIPIPKDKDAASPVILDLETEAMTKRCMELKTSAILSAWEELGGDRCSSLSSVVERLVIAAACIDHCWAGQTELCGMMSKELKEIASAFADVIQSGSRANRHRTPSRTRSPPEFGDSDDRRRQSSRWVQRRHSQKWQRGWRSRPSRSFGFRGHRRFYNDYDDWRRRS